MTEEQSSRGMFVVGKNDNGTYYEVAHTATCKVGKEIGTWRKDRREWFETLAEAKAKATEHRLGRCCGG